MERFFNTAGPIKPDKHYHLPLLHRMDWEEIQVLIAHERYFVLHAPRQTGKTSSLLAIMEALNMSGTYNAVYANIEGAQAARGDVSRGIPEVARALTSDADFYLGDPRPKHLYQELRSTTEPEGLLSELLSGWAQLSEKPLVLLLDEVDALVGNTLISLLRQLRAGYTKRPRAFPQSVILCGVRDVRDYRMEQPGGEIITGGSAFNIKAKSLRMGNFTKAENRELLMQHTRATGQVFDERIFPELWEDTYGQPWLVNALAHEMVWEDRQARERSFMVDLEHYFAARERLIRSRATHLDQLADKLRENRVKRVIEALLSGEEPASSCATPTHWDDQQYVEDLGLIVTSPWVHISNRIYREIIPRELTVVAQSRILPDQPSHWYLTPENRLDMMQLMRAFQQFFRENADSWIERFDYKEAGPQLLMQAFLQRIINGGGRLNREYGLGRKRTDLIIEWPQNTVKGMFGPVQRVVIELKIKRGRLETLLPGALEQTADYADKAGTLEAHLVVFDRDPDVHWEEKIWHMQKSWGQRTIEVWGC